MEGEEVVSVCDVWLCRPVFSAMNVALVVLCGCVRVGEVV